MCEFAFVQPRRFNGQEKSYLASKNIKWAYATSAGPYSHDPRRGVMVRYPEQPPLAVIALLEKKMGTTFCKYSVKAYSRDEFPADEGCIALFPRAFDTEEVAYLKYHSTPWTYHTDAGLKDDLLFDRKRRTPFTDDNDAVLVNFPQRHVPDRHITFLRESMTAYEIPMRCYSLVKQ